MHRLFRLSPRRALLILLPLLVLSACKPQLIPATSVPDTKENRAIVEFVDLYRRAIENRSLQGVMELVAEDYFEDGGKPLGAAPYGYSQLEEKLSKTFDKIENLSLRIHVQNIEKREKFVDVVYYFVQRALVKYPSNSKWVASDDVNRIILRLKGKDYRDGFEIVSGL